MSIQQLQEKWAPVLNHDALPEIKDSHKRGVVAQLLENQEKAQIEPFRPLVTLVAIQQLVLLQVSTLY
jgi:hypothetical protein